MPRSVTRKFLQQFGGSGSSSFFGKFGSQLAGTPTNSKDPVVIQALAAWLDGWQSAIYGANKDQFLEDMNGLCFVFGWHLYYLLQDGLPEWDASTTYFTGSMVKRIPSPGANEIWVSLTDNNTGNALPTNQTDSINWGLILPSRFGSLLGQIALAQIPASLAGDGLVGANGSALAVNPDNSTLEISADQVRVKDGGITNAKIVSVDASKITNLAALGIPYSYRRPVLKWIDEDNVDVEANVGVANKTTIIFPDGQALSVTEDTSSSTKYRRFTITETANFTSGTENSGLRSGLSRGQDTWYAIYAVKSQIDSTKFVLVGDTTLPLLANVATLNSAYGANAWLYLGMIRNGNGGYNTYAPDNKIINFVQSGNKFQFKIYQAVFPPGGSLRNFTNMAIGFSGGNVNAYAFTPTHGTGMNDIPDHLGIVDMLLWAASYSAASTLKYSYEDNGAEGGLATARAIAANDFTLVRASDVSSYSTLYAGLIGTGTPTANLAFYLTGWTDPLLIGVASTI